MVSSFFTVVTDQHSAAISVQAVDDVGYSLKWRNAGWWLVYIVQIYEPQG